MNSLNKKLILYAVSAVAITASIGFFTVANNYGVLKIDFDNLFRENEKNKSQIEEQALTIQELAAEIRTKDDSIATLNFRIIDLAEEAESLREKVRSLDQKVQQKMDEINALTAKIKDIEGRDQISQSKIADLEAKRNSLLLQVQNMDDSRTNEKERLVAAQKELELKNRTIRYLENQNAEQRELLNKRINTSPSASSEKDKEEPMKADPQPLSPNDATSEQDVSIEKQKDEIINARKQARMREIATATRIEYQSIRLKKDLRGKDLDKKATEDWRYAVIEFDLTNPDQDAILHEDFIVQVFDTDNGKVVPFNENNPMYQNSETGANGFKFSYEGKSMKVEYFNSQKKTANNYEIRFYYAGKGFMLPIASGKTSLVENGTVAGR